MAEGEKPAPRGGRRRSTPGKDDVGELIVGDEVRTGLISGQTFHAKPVEYVVKDGLALFEGDIVLGTADEMEQRTRELEQELSGGLERGVIRTGAQFRWPSCRIPYTIDAALPNKARVTDAIAHWEARTRYRFVVRTNQADWVTFRPASGCSSSVGRQGGQQFVNLGAGCSTGNTIHEIGHVVGLWHEQSRQDRDQFVTIVWNKIQAGAVSNFNQHITDGDDVGPYDYGSIMHYPRTAFSIDGSDTIIPTNPPTAQIGQRTALSAGDIAAANSMCPVVKAKDPIKDGRLDTRKERIKDIRLDTRKELVLDTRKELVKERVKEVALDPIKRVGGDVVRPGFGPVVNPVIGGQLGRQPFALAVRQRAPELADQGAEDLEATVAEVDAALQAVADQLLELDAQRDALQAQYDELQGLLEGALDAHDEASE